MTQPSRIDGLPDLPDFSGLHEAISSYSETPHGVAKGARRQAILAQIRCMLEDYARSAAAAQAAKQVPAGFVLREVLSELNAIDTAVEQWIEDKQPVGSLLIKAITDNIRSLLPAAPSATSLAEAAEAGQVEAIDDGLVTAFPHIALGHGLVEIGDATWEGLPALFFGKNGAEVGPIGSKRVRDNLAQDGETLALITFANLKGLEQVEDALGRVRRNMEASQGKAQ